jgi:outer membrane receptor protein involved in Fe transport
MSRLLPTAVGVLLVLCPRLAAGQDQEDLEVELFFAPAETVKSAARHIQPLALSPSAVTVLTREDVETSGARTLPELLRLVPNMDIHMVKPLWYTVGVRGGTSNTSDTMLLLVDGRDVTMEFFGFPLWAAFPLSMDEVERVEVIRGPGSALYGANAFAGVVNVITREPGTGPRLLASVRGGESGLGELNCRGSGHLGPLAYSAGVGLARENRWTGRKPDREHLRGWLKGRLDLAPESDLMLEAGGFTVSGTLQSDLGEIGVEDGFAPYVQSRFTFQDLLMHFSYERIEFRLDMGWALKEKNLGIVIAEIPAFDCSGDKITSLLQHSVDVYHNKVTYGAQYVFGHYWGEAMIPQDFYEHRLGLFAQDELDLSGVVESLSDTRIPPLVLTAGLRFDYNSVTKYELSPRASFVFMPADGHSFRLGYARAYLKPTFMESSLRLRLNDVKNFGFKELNAGTAGLDNQLIDSVEAGYRGSFLDGRLLARLDFAYNWYNNQIAFQYDEEKIRYKEFGTLRIPDITGPGIGFATVKDQRRGHDVELELAARPSERSRLFFSAGYRQFFNDDTNKFSEREPVWRLGAGADYSARDGWKASVRLFYTSPYARELPDPESILEPTRLVRLPATFLLNARLAWKLTADPLGFTLGVEAFNLLDSPFREHAGVTPPNGPDYAGERLGRRIVLFLQGEI